MTTTEQTPDGPDLIAALQLAKKNGPAAMVAAHNGEATRVAFEADPVTFATLQMLRFAYRSLTGRRVSTTLILRRAVQGLAGDLAGALRDRDLAKAELREIEKVRP